MLIRVPVNIERPSRDALDAAIVRLHAGRVVAFPTDTLYGLAVDPRSGEAVAALFALKGRAASAPVPLIASDLAQAERDAGVITPLARRLAGGFWPGPLTLVLDARSTIAPAVHAGTNTVGVRVPAQPLARALASAAGHVLTATSANRSGEGAARTADEVESTFRDSDMLLLDAGPLPESLPSTIVDARGAAPLLLRAGAVAWDRVLEFLRDDNPSIGCADRSH
jgi:L-threonylcarbamoyladenylate synthase